MLVFFEVGEGTYLTLDLDQEEENGICPVYYFDKKIAAITRRVFEENG